MLLECFSPISQRSEGAVEVTVVVLLWIMALMEKDNMEIGMSSGNRRDLLCGRLDGLHSSQANNHLTILRELLVSTTGLSKELAIGNRE